jgi:hypothetical protein
MQQNEVLAAAAVKLALSHVGEREATGNNDGAFVDAIEKPFGERHAAWCAMYATSMIKFAAQALGIKTMLHASESSTEIYAQGKAKGLSLAKPIPNCIGLLRGNGGSPGKDHHHTFLVVSVDAAAGVVHGIDGNWENRVTKTLHPISGCDFVAVA